MFRETPPYPCTSVGNNLSDLARRLPDLVLGIVGELIRGGDMDLVRVDEYTYKKRIYRRDDYQGN